MKKPSWDRTPFRTVELIALSALTVLAFTYFWPFVERRMMPPVEVDALVRIEPPKVPYGPTAADVPEYGEVGRRFLTSPEGLGAIWSQVNPGLRPGYQDASRLGRWIDDRLWIVPIKGTFLIRYSCVVEDPARDVPYLKATVNALVEHLNGKALLDNRVSILDPVLPPRILPIPQRLRLIYAAGFVLVALLVSFAVVKVALIHDSRQRFAV